MTLYRELGSFQQKTSQNNIRNSIHKKKKKKKKRNTEIKGNGFEIQRRRSIK